jgi:asparagine synthase (glutamine-hydrolysing)
MMMGNSVEGRFPFLDYRLIEFANTIPPDLKMKVLDEKYILKQTFASILPSSIIKRDKQPYRAPIYQSFIDFKNNLPQSFLQPEVLKAYGYFNLEAVERLVNKALKAKGKPLSAREDMAMVGIMSLQLLHHHFLEKSGRLNVIKH